MILKQFLITIFLILFLAVDLLAQAKRELVFRSNPRSLQPQLVKRIALFTDYQRNQDWDKVRIMLTDFFVSYDGKTKLSEKQIDNLLTGIKERPVIKFTPKVTWFSTANYSRPLNQRSWILWGCGQYLKDGQVVQTPIGLNMYLKERQWIFGNFIYWKMTDRYSCDEEEGKAKQP